MANHNFHVGDEFEGSPIQLNRWISPVWAAGGKVEFDGNTAIIVYLPEDPSEEVEIIAEVKEEVVPEPVEEIIPAPLPVEELEEVAAEPVVVEEVQEEVAVEPVAVEPVAVEPVAVEEVIEEVAIAPAPKYRGRPKKSFSSTEEVK